MKREESGKSRDPFLCTCGPCKRFWRSTFGPEVGQLKRSPACRSKSVTSQSSNNNPYLPLGRRVVVQDKHPGTVRYVGYLDTPSDTPKLYVGVKLDDNVHSTHNGIFQGKRYFYCPKGHAAFVRPNHLRPASAPNKKPALAGNFMFPSYEVVKQRRKEREQQLASLGDSSSSCGGSVIESRSLPTLERRRPPPILKVTSDPNDMVNLDRQRNIEREKRRWQMSPMEIQNPHRKKEPTQLQKWKAEFGGDERAARMAETLQKLHLAYEEGRKLLEGEATCE